MVKLTTSVAGLVAACGLIALVVSNNEGSVETQRNNLRQLSSKFYARNDDDYFTPQEVADMNQKLQSGKYSSAYVQSSNLYGDGEDEEEGGESLWLKKVLAMPSPWLVEGYILRLTFISHQLGFPCTCIEEEEEFKLKSEEPVRRVVPKRSEEQEQQMSNQAYEASQQQNNYYKEEEGEEESGEEEEPEGTYTHQMFIHL